MHIQEAVASRHSIRAFLPTPVDGEIIRRVLTQAARAPSGGNLQPWHIDVLAGDALATLKARMRERLVEGGEPEPTDYDIYPPALRAPWRDRRFQVGEAMYARLGIPREDKAARRRWFSRNFDFFGAPLAAHASSARCMPGECRVGERCMTSVRHPNKSASSNASARSWTSWYIRTKRPRDSNRTS